MLEELRKRQLEIWRKSIEETSRLIHHPISVVSGSILEEEPQGDPEGGRGDVEGSYPLETTERSQSQASARALGHH